MDSVIFHQRVKGERYQYKAKYYRDEGNIIWYNPSIKQYEVFNDITEWIFFLDSNLEDQVFEELGWKLDQDWEQIKEDFETTQLEKIKEEKEDFGNSFFDNFGSIFKSLETLGF